MMTSIRLSHREVFSFFKTDTPPSILINIYCPNYHRYLKSHRSSFKEMDIPIERDVMNIDCALLDFSNCAPLKRERSYIEFRAVDIKSNSFICECRQSRFLIGSLFSTAILDLISLSSNEKMLRDF